MNIADCVKETTTSTSAATITLAGAVAKFQAFAAAFDVGAAGIPVRVDDLAGKWENGFYTLTNGTTLTRTEISSSSNGGAPVTFGAGEKEVSCIFHEGVMSRMARDDSAALAELGDPNAVSLFVKTAAGVRLIPLTVAGITGLQLPMVASLAAGDFIPVVRADGSDARITYANLQAQLGGSPAPSPTVTGVTVSPSSPSVAGGASQTFTATVAGTNSPAQTVTWTASAGSITSGGVFTAPASTASAQTITITARSTVDTTKTGAATVTVPATGSPAPTVSSVTVSPSTANVAGDATQQFTATVSGTNSPSQGVNWTASAGTINTVGLFTAPAATSSVQTITITATSQQDGTKSGVATVTVAAAAAAAVPPPYTARTTTAGGTAITGAIWSPTAGATWTSSTNDSYASGGTSIRMQILHNVDGTAAPNVKFVWAKIDGSGNPIKPAGVSYASIELPVGATGNASARANGLASGSRYGSWTAGGATTQQYYGVFNLSGALYAWTSNAGLTAQTRCLAMFIEGYDDPIYYTNGTGTPLLFNIAMP